MRFDWDPKKARQNLSMHGIDFEDAKRAVLDLFRLEFVDDRFDYDEERIQIIGACFGEVLFVVIVFRAEDHCRIHFRSPGHAPGKPKVFHP